MKDTILVIDTGSSSMRGILFDLEGNVCDSRQEMYQMQIEGDAAWQHAEDFEKALFKICISLEQSIGSYQLRAIAFTSQRSSVVPIDHDGVVIDSFMMWYDKRATYICKEMNMKFKEMLLTKGGTLSSPVLSAPKIKWIRDNKMDVYQNTYKFMGVHEYLLYLATGQTITDTSTACRTNLMDIHTRKWSDNLLAAYEIDKEKLCTILEQGAVAGTVSEEFSKKHHIPSNTVVISAGGDQQCSACGLGLSEEGDIGITVGSGAYVTCITDVCNTNNLENLTLSAYVNEKWMFEGSCPSAGTAYNWAKKVFAVEELGDLKIQLQLNNVCAGANGVIMLPDFVGGGVTEKNRNRKGEFIQISLATTRDDLLRAVMEGIAASIWNIFLDMKKQMKGINHIYIAGGLSNSDVFCQMLTDMLQFNIIRCNSAETTALGAYYIALKKLGFEKEYASIEDGLKKNRKVFYPNEINHAIYEEQNGIRNSHRNK